MMTATELLLTGQVQGRAVRPALARLATEHGLAGEVRNTLQGLSVILEGFPEAIERCVQQIPGQLPVGTQLTDMQRRDVVATNRSEFVIGRDDRIGPLDTPIPVDIGVCSNCLTDVVHSDNRRFQYPLTTCAACGPRWSLIRSMPYERDQTTLAKFPLCEDCQLEYRNPADRRFHAQTMGCPQCGPQIWGVSQHGNSVAAGAQAIEAAVAVIRAGQIVALRGVGGYQLLCDAANSAAVTRLRIRKGRPSKPLALLVESLPQARQLADLSPDDCGALTATANPIVLCRLRGTGVAPEVHPGLSDVGVMLPSSPLHALLSHQFGGPLVCTSGNREGDPLEFEVTNAEQRLQRIADFWLHHDRPIVRPIDDSVVRVIGGRPVTIRLGRGLAPQLLPIRTTASVLALGGQQKVACAWSNGQQAVLGPHLGDMETLASRDRVVDQMNDVQSLYRVQFDAFTCDLHPEYFTSRLAPHGQSCVPVQHHLAHVAAGMLEHELLDRDVLGIAWDGTGIGTDGTFWGSEFLRVSPDFEVQRIAHLRPFPLIGGEKAIREPWRVALTLLMEALSPEVDVSSLFPGVDLMTIRMVRSLVRQSDKHPQTTSAGRLFDAAAAIAMSVDMSGFEGHPAMLLESIADHTAAGEYQLPLTASAPIQLDWRPLMAELWSDRRNGISPGVMSMKFHRTLARGIVTLGCRFASLPIVLSGGVFQNRLLTELIIELAAGTLLLYFPGRIPPNDGGLAAGQLVVAARRLQTAMRT